jgi:hypothetical protein
MHYNFQGITALVHDFFDDFGSQVVHKRRFCRRK